MTSDINVNTQKEELKEINNQLALLMAKKRAIQKYLKKEEGIKDENVKRRIVELRDDKEFIEKNGRSRYYWEIGNEVGYSESSIKRVFKEMKKWSIMTLEKLIPRFFLFKLK